MIMSEYINNFPSSFLVWMTFIYLYYLIVPARTSSTILNRCGERGQPCLERKFFQFFPLIMLTMGLLCMTFIMLRYGLPIHNLLKIFIMKGDCISSYSFYVSIEVIMWFLFYILFMRWITLIALCILSILPSISPKWSWHIILLMCSWLWFVYIFLRNCAHMFIKDIDL